MERLAIRTISGSDLDPDFPEEVDISLAVKSNLLFANVEGERTAAVLRSDPYRAFTMLSKLEGDYPVVFLEDGDFEVLRSKSLEIKAEKDLSEIEDETEGFDEYEDVSVFLKNSEDILTSEESAPIIKLVNAIFYQAIKKRASDIHIEAHENGGIVRFRIDGVLIDHMKMDSRIVPLVVSRIKVISNLDISEKRVPQDGRTHVKISGKTLDVRVSVLPTYYGERVVMRILMESESIPPLEKLGFDMDMVNKLYKVVKRPYGIFLVTGPTGSGKSTTLHSCLQKVVSPEKNIVTIEDPVEYKAERVNQIQVNEKAGLTFASGLRSILRQDPDVIMIGEIRDSETARIAIQAALTGHLVFSTLHTNTAVGAVTRLVDMGIEPFLISSSIIGVLSQRLVRTLCSCKKRVGEKWIPVGCESCSGTGYRGRRAIGELFVVDNEIREMIKTGKSEQEMEAEAVKKGMSTLESKILDMVSSGDTSEEEFCRIGFLNGI